MAKKGMNSQELLQGLNLLPVMLRSEYKKKLPILQQQGSISDLFLHLNQLFMF